MKTNPVRKGGVLFLRPRRRGRTFATKQVEAYAVEQADGWLVITVMVKYY